MAPGCCQSQSPVLGCDSGAAAGCCWQASNKEISQEGGRGQLLAGESLHFQMGQGSRGREAGQVVPPLGLQTACMIIHEM